MKKLVSLKMCSYTWKKIEGFLQILPEKSSVFRDGLFSFLSHGDQGNSQNLDHPATKHVPKDAIGYVDISCTYIHSASYIIHVYIFIYTYIYTCICLYVGNA